MNLFQGWQSGSFDRFNFNGAVVSEIHLNYFTLLFVSLALTKILGRATFDIFDHFASFYSEQIDTNKTMSVRYQEKWKKHF